LFTHYSSIPLFQFGHERVRIFGKIPLPHCGQVYLVQRTRWRCDCGSFLDLQFEPTFEIKKILKRKTTLWRYREALPIAPGGSILSMGEGFTPLESMGWNGHRVLLKIDYLFPTGSYKDRGATILISKARELGIKKVVEDSSGNAGSAIAAYCARAGIGCRFMFPRPLRMESWSKFEPTELI
jgi:threonine synthase